MTTNQDILSFLKADIDARAKEKEEEKAIRAGERQDDMKQILDLIQQGIKKEVNIAIKPLEDRLEMQETINKKLFNQLESVTKELNTLKKAVNEHQGCPQHPQPHHQQVLPVQENIETRSAWNTV